MSEAVCLMVPEMRGMRFLKIFMYFIKVKYWLQGRGEKRDAVKGWTVKGLQYQVMGNGLKYMGFEVNFENKGFLRSERI